MSNINNIVDKINVGFQITGASPVNINDKKGYIVQGPGKPPLKVNADESKERELKTKPGTQAQGKTISLEEVHCASVEQGNTSHITGDEFSDAIVKQLQEHGIIITRLIAPKPSSGKEPCIYYEAYTRAGDKFLLKIHNDDSAAYIYIPDVEEGVTGAVGATGPTVATTTKGVSREYSEVHGDILPIRSKNYDKCHSDPICNTLFTCEGLSSKCEMDTDTHRSVVIKKLGVPEGSIGAETVIFYEGAPIGIPVVTCNEFLSRPHETTTRIAELTSKYQSQSMSTNIGFIRSAAKRMNVFSQTMTNAMNAYDKSLETLKENQAEASELVGMWEKHGNASNDEERLKYDALVHKRMAFNSLAANLVSVAEGYIAQIDEVDVFHKRIIDKNVKLWVQTKLRLNNISTAKDAWSLPDEITNMTQEDLENVFAGDIKIFRNKIESVSKEETTKKLFGILFPGTKKDITDNERIVLLIDKVAKSSLPNKLSDEAEIKAAYRIYGLGVLLKIVEEISPKMKAELARNIGKGACPKNNECFNYDVEQGKVTAKVDGNLPTYAAVSSGYTETKGITKHDATHNKFTHDIETLIRSMNT